MSTTPTTPSQNPIGGLQRTPFLSSPPNEKYVSREWIQWFNGVALSKNVPSFISDTHANRDLIPAANYANGTLFFESDRKVLYIAVNGSWFYFSGVMQATQATLPTDLLTEDTNFLVNVTDYAHLLEWTGTAWTWGPAELGSGFIMTFLNAPNPTTGWQLCDGSANIPQLNADGTLQFVTVPSSGDYFRQ